jgi:hypothetical protein
LTRLNWQMTTRKLSDGVPSCASLFIGNVSETSRKHSAGRRIRLPFRPIIQKHQTCVPASVAVALSASGGIISAEEMAAAVTFGGTYEWSAADWLRARGFHVRFFPVTAEVAKSLIEHQIAFAC